MTSQFLQFAHGVGAGRADLPISLKQFIVAAVIVLAVSFLALAALWSRPKLEQPPVRRIPRALSAVLLSRPLGILCGAIGVFLLGVTVWAGLTGVQTSAANFAPIFVYVAFWLGLVPVSLLFGDVFRAFNPWRAIGRAVAWVAQLAARGPMPPPLTYPERLGRWPAAVGIFAFATLELVVSGGDLPDNVAVATLIYSAATFVGMALYGVDTWCDRGEAFGVYFNLFSRLSVFGRQGDHVVLRPPLSGVAQLAWLPGTVALLAVMIGSVSFDGVSESSLWTGLSPDIAGAFESLGFSPQRAFEASRLIGLTTFIALIFGFYRLGTFGVSLLGGGRSQRDLALAFVHSLVPIALAYAAAHYLSLLVFQGQAMAYLVSDPLGNGNDLFGTAGRAIDYGVIGFTFTSFTQIALVVVGHVAGLTLAHDRALVLFDRPRMAVLSQCFMLLVMVGFTILALLLLLQSNS